jgi:DNA integrity scanning protein DisA with diadenylate cyclase activity
MTTTLTDKLVAWMTLLSGLTVSAVAIYYSVIGLVAIFAAAVIPIIVMGVVLETSKLVATVWLKWNWRRAPKFIKAYLLIAIFILMMITSMGIFGFLSKAHLDQAVPVGDVADKVALIDEKIKTQRENIEMARRALSQMDAQVNERLSRSDDERGAERAVQIRRQQARERTALQNEISVAQAEISKLNDERSPIAKDLRAVEAEVGPIKYIAALIYGDNPDANLLEKSVRWVIIIIVLVFDPLAVILLLSSQYSFQWFRQDRESKIQNDKKIKEAVDESFDDYPEPQDTQYIHSPWPFPVKETKEVPTSDITSPENFGLEKKVEINQPIVEESKQEDKILEETFIEEVTPEDDHEILETASLKEKEAMHRWKEENPKGSLKLQRKMLAMGRIDRLPWEDYLKPEADFKEYVQNQEQSDSTLWQRVKNAKGVR